MSAAQNHQQVDNTKLAPTDQMPAFLVDATEKLTANYSFSSNYFATFTFL
jgi:hypothetical protein